MRLLVDMNLSPRWIEWLAAEGFEAVHWSTVGAGDAPDTVIMSYARMHDFIVLTHDLDFGAILAATQGEKPSVMQIRSEDLNPDSIGVQVTAAIQQTAAELREGALVTVDMNRVRVRILPLLIHQKN